MLNNSSQVKGKKMLHFVMRKHQNDILGLSFWKHSRLFLFDEIEGFTLEAICMLSGRRYNYQD
jgi:hypothetical protein